MKTLFSIILIFLFISCSGGKKTPESIVPDEDGEQDIDIVDDDDDDDDDEDEDEDTEPDMSEKEMCRTNERCENVKNSTGVCFLEDSWPGYSCECIENYTWVHTQYDFKCMMTRPAECTGLPEHAEWYSVSSITQMSEEGENWSPSTEGRWNDGKCETSCCFKCVKNDPWYFWNGSECVNLCENNSCENRLHSTGDCFSVGAYNYTCGCEEGYYWWGERLGCIAQKPASGNICTGARECFNNSEQIECPASGEDFYGQDAQYAAAGACAPHDFEIKSEFPEEQTVLVRNTGLEWTRKFFENKPWEEALDYCENLTYAGHDDWRLPSRQEILSVYDESKLEYSGLQGIYFQGWHPYPAFWSSDSYNGSKVWAFTTVTTGGLTISLSSKTDQYGFLCLRGEKFPKPVLKILTVNGDEIVTDSTTGFMWQKNSDFNGEQREWRQALNYCENLIYAGYSDWRLPNKNELLSLVSYKDDNPDSDFSWFEDETNQYYFSSSTTIRYYKNVSEISSINGVIASINKTEKDYNLKGGSVRCVRSDICGEGLFLKDSECVSNPCKAKSCEVANSTGVCIPKTELSYECQCVDGYFWNGSKCVNPCDADPCSKIANSDKNCTPVNSTLYFCGCNDGYGWNSGKCSAYATDAVTLGNICTGDIQCFDKGFKIECPAENESYYGQDAQYAASGSCKKQEFELKTVSNQEIVVDKNTKLEWQHAVSEKTYTWNDALSYCDNLVYAGYSDWRVPEPHELMTITDYSAYDSCEADSDEYTSTLVNRLYFKDIMPSFAVGSNLWTSKENLDDSSRAWGFSPKHGHVYSYPLKTYRYNVMCVRGNKLPKANFTNKSAAGNFASALIDLTTGLMWQKSFTEMENETWENALSYCENLTHSGYSDWRLPNKNELVSLISYDKDDPFSILFNIPDEYGFVSSTTRREDVNPAYANYVDIYGIEIFNYAEMIDLKGELGGVTKSKGSFNVRCVRNFE